ncbi:MAG: hypothetical protein GY777_09250 [Candidatus Brocadiaceae bacterium]|nr:hypothetical protein [Candidatus Brocadiaceae bacterium]
MIILSSPNSHANLPTGSPQRVCLRHGRQGRKNHNEKQRQKQKKDNKEARKSGVKTVVCGRDIDAYKE